MCETLGVSKSGYYDWLNRPISEQAKRKKKLTKVVKQIHDQSHGIYGSPKITDQLEKQGYVVSGRTVQRIMKDLSIKSRAVKKFKVQTTDSNHDHRIYPNLLDQQFIASAPGEVWVADITYIWTSEGWLYLASIMDLYSRKIIGFNMGNRLAKELVIVALKRAMTAQPPKEGLIHHSDRGSQYASQDYIKLLKGAEINVSMSRRGNCYDNACIEAFHSVIKREWIYHYKYQTRDEAMKSVFYYVISFYNEVRTHSTNDYLSPNQKERNYGVGRFIAL
jgi:putative transposase